jgi:anti-sigma-K factor RskA
MNSHLDFHERHDHLSDKQIDDHLIGDLAAEPAAHLAACSVCTDRVATAADPLSSFRNVTMAWSERRSATLPIPDLSQQRPLWQRHMPWAAACFAFAIGVALTNASRQAVTRTAELQPMQHEMQTTTQQAPVLIATASIDVAPRAHQVAADNRMLKAIDAALDTSADSPVALGIEPVSARSRRRPAPASLQD